MQGLPEASRLGIPLKDPPTDGISAVRFSPRSDNLLVSSWDRKVRLYDASANEMKREFEQRGPVLDCCFPDENFGFSGGIEKCIKRHDFETGNEEVLGNHESTVKYVEYSHSTGQLISGGWDCYVCGWDSRTTSADSQKMNDVYNPVTRLKLPERVYSASLNEFTLVVATSGRQVFTLDLRNLSQILYQRESALKFQTRCVRIFPDNTGYAISSIEGRVSMEFFDMSEDIQSKKYAFKCHRRVEDGRDVIFPVNDIQFHPVYGTFVTGGSDGIVNAWDGTNKKRLFQYPRYPTDISSLSFNSDGRLLAIASSYAYEFGDIIHEPDAIFIRAVNEIEVKPKPKVASATLPPGS